MPEETIFCPHCGAQQLKASARFCHACGQPIPVSLTRAPAEVSRWKLMLARNTQCQSLQYSDSGPSEDDHPNLCLQEVRP